VAAVKRDRSSVTRPTHGMNYHGNHHIQDDSIDKKGGSESKSVMQINSVTVLQVLGDVVSRSLFG
jgi:hypothetical protein